MYKGSTKVAHCQCSPLPPTLLLPLLTDRQRDKIHTLKILAYSTQGKEDEVASSQMCYCWASSQKLRQTNFCRTNCTVSINLDGTNYRQALITVTLHYSTVIDILPGCWAGPGIEQAKAFRTWGPIIWTTVSIMAWFAYPKLPPTVEQA